MKAPGTRPLPKKEEMSAKEARTLLGVGQRTLGNYVKAGRIRVRDVPHGGRFYRFYHRADVLDLAASFTRKAAEQKITRG